ncbi:MAG: pantetheine-phosphate adenylyltransferase [Pseudomonadota bacterium]
MSPSKAVYAGSFDPITYGHIDIIRRGLKLFDEIIIGVGNNQAKSYLFSVEDRIEMCTQSIKEFSNITVDSVDGLLIEFAESHNCKAIIRGLRLATDFEFELQLGMANQNINPDVESIFLLTHPKNIFVSSSMVKDIARNWGNVQYYVPKFVAQKLGEKFPK